MQMMYWLHIQPSEELAQRLRRRFPWVFGAHQTPPSKPAKEHRAQVLSISNEDILADLHYGRAA